MAGSWGSVGEEIIIIAKRIFQSFSRSRVRTLADDLPNFIVLGGKPTIFGPRWNPRRPPWETTADTLLPGWTPDTWKNKFIEGTEEHALEWARNRGI